MNAAARVLSESLDFIVTPSRTKAITVSKQMMLILTLITLIIISALMLITISDENRINIGKLAALQQNHDDLKTTYNQLLLEENTWDSPARVQKVAQDALKMSQPDPKQVIIINQ
jgi:cell division protein FtsL